MPQPMMQGRAGRAPKTMKAIRVTTPHFIATFSSTTTRPSSSNIMMLTKAWSLVEMRSAMRLQSSMEKPFSRQISMISFFSSLTRFYTSQSSLASSDLMYCISALAERQSPNPMPMPSPTMAAMQKDMMSLAFSSLTIPVRTMMRVLMPPSNPPQTSDLRMSPASMWFSSCSVFSVCSISCFFRFSLVPPIQSLLIYCDQTHQFTISIQFTIPIQVTITIELTIAIELTIEYSPLLLKCTPQNFQQLPLFWLHQLQPKFNKNTKIVYHQGLASSKDNALARFCLILPALLLLPHFCFVAQDLLGFLGTAILAGRVV